MRWLHLVVFIGIIWVGMGMYGIYHDWQEMSKEQPWKDRSTGDRALELMGMLFALLFTFPVWLVANTQVLCHHKVPEILQRHLGIPMIHARIIVAIPFFGVFGSGIAFIGIRITTGSFLSVWGTTLLCSVAFLLSTALGLFELKKYKIE